ncbi:MAG: carbohydrate ABC transporter substrate-binding protein [Provencibacterium sp.]|nr:carbohydrate ABC transporter substrate-binding protein [Provencibacterium sp.]
MKKALSLLCMAALLLAAASGCGAGGSPSSSGASRSEISSSSAGISPSSSESEKEPVTLRVVWWGSQDRHDKTLKVLDLFKAEYPHITIEPEYLAWTNYWERLASQAAASTMPDVIQNDYNYIETYARNGLCIPLDSLIGQEIHLDDVDDLYLAGGRVDGQIYGVNLGSGGPAVVYDPEIFAQAGLEEPDPSWTYADYEKAMRAIREKLDIFGATGLQDGGMYRGLEVYCRQYGQSIFSHDGSALNFDKQLFIDYYTMYTGWETQRLVPTPDALGDARVNIEANFICTGDSAMTCCNSNQIVSLVAAAGRPLKMTTVPMAEDQVQYGGYIKPSMFWSISKDAQAVEAGAQLIDFFTNSVEANRILMAERGVPISAAVREALAPDLEDTQKVMFDYIAQYAQYASEMDAPQPAAFAEISSLMDNYEQKIVFGEMSVEAAADEFMKKAGEAIQNAAG